MAEELKIILETLENLGESALTFAIWYLVVKLAAPVITGLCFVFAVTCIYKAILRVAVIVNAGWTLARELGHDAGDQWVSRDTRDCVNIIRELQANQKEGHRA